MTLVFDIDTRMFYIFGTSPEALLRVLKFVDDKMSLDGGIIAIQNAVGSFLRSLEQSGSFDIILEYDVNTGRMIVSLPVTS